MAPDEQSAFIDSNFYDAIQKAIKRADADVPMMWNRAFIAACWMFDIHATAARSIPPKGIDPEHWAFAPNPKRGALDPWSDDMILIWKGRKQ